MIERINWKELFGVRVPVTSVEDNIVLKAILQRREEEGKHDVGDIISMAAHEKMDTRYPRKRILKSRVDERVMPLLRQLIPSCSKVPKCI